MSDETIGLDEAEGVIGALRAAVDPAVGRRPTWTGSGVESASTTAAPVPRRRSKRVLDLCLTVPAILLLLPFMLAIAVAIKLEGWIRGKPVPLLYRETRITRGLHFSMCKFRTIRADVDLASSAQGVKAMESRENLTGVGRLLQAYYLDELPQLFNVLLGHMSLVGPRPVQPHIYQNELLGGIDLRRWMPGGLTGRFQVEKGVGNFRERRISLDQEYFDRYRFCGSLGLIAHDLSLLGRTLRTLLCGGGW